MGLSVLEGPFRHITGGVKALNASGVPRSGLAQPT
jgi:hypothetical protein